MAYLITCAGSKQKPTVLNPNSIHNLTHSTILLETRLRLLELTGIQLDWDYTLPAWQLYSGSSSRFYSKVNKGNWGKPCIEIKILSALFGWIAHTDRIPYYDLRMDNIIYVNGNKQSIWRYWRDTHLLDSIINPSTDIDLLSVAYRKAINSKKTNIAILPNVHFTDYGGQKGQWLNNQLDKLTCQDD